MAASIQHVSLNAIFKGIQRDDQNVPVHQFLGIRYASIPARFEKAEPMRGFDGAIVDASKYGYAVFTQDRNRPCVGEPNSYTDI